MKIAKVLLAVMMVSGLALAQNSNSAKGNWDQNHPRRAEVNQRVDNQIKRVNQEERRGEISHAQAHKLKANDRRIKREERNMARQNGGHLTKQEQKDLNHQLNRNSRKIGK